MTSSIWIQSNTWEVLSMAVFWKAWPNLIFCKCLTGNKKSSKSKCKYFGNARLATTTSHRG